jgi:flagellar protein FlbT
MAFELRLEPGEKFVLNGATVTNGDREALLELNDNTPVLRASEIMQPQDANTPSRRIYFAIQMMYLDGERLEMHYDGFVMRMIEYINHAEERDALLICLDVSRAVKAKAYGDALTLCRDLIALEIRSRAAPSIADDQGDVAWA